MIPVLLLNLVTSCLHDPLDTPADSRKPYRQPSNRAGGYYYSAPQNPYGYGGAYQYPPASRYYNNPYAFPPQNSTQYYDGDQYYRPPSAYGATSDNNITSIQRY